MRQEKNQKEKAGPWWGAQGIPALLLVAQGVMGPRDRPTIFKINKAKELGLLAQLGWCRELVWVSVHEALPGHGALARHRQDVMPDVAREVQVQPPVPTKPLLGWPSLDPVPFPSLGQEKATTRYKHLQPAPCPCPLCCESWAQRAVQPQKAEQLPQLQPSLAPRAREGNARAGSSQEQGRRQLKKVLP